MPNITTNHAITYTNPVLTKKKASFCHSILQVLLKHFTLLLYMQKEIHTVEPFHNGHPGTEESRRCGEVAVMGR